MTTADSSFSLLSVSHLESPTGASAASLEALREAIAEAGHDVLFHHVTRLPIRFANARDLPANDFARWARTALQDPAAAEQLAFAGAPSLAPLEEVRASLLAALERVPERRRRHESPEETAFRFVRARSVTAPLSARLSDPRDISTHWPLLDQASVFYHLVEASVLGPEPAALIPWLEARGAATLARHARELAAAGLPLARLHRELGARWRRRLIPERLVRRLDASEELRRAEAHAAIARLAGRLRGTPEASEGGEPEPEPPESSEGGRP
ncbi:MAG TPA: DUF5752 family protein [Candidatus Eisenbacteria bacterium]|nr:DUF5752 family protein [Candidatus Eisenbacteria bacterium]